MCTKILIPPHEKILDTLLAHLVSTYFTNLVRQSLYVSSAAGIFSCHRPTDTQHYYNYNFFNYFIIIYNIFNIPMTIYRSVGSGSAMVTNSVITK